MDSTTRSAAERIVASMQEVCGVSHTLVRVDPAEFSHLDLPVYEAIRQHLGRLGFRHLADVEVPALSQAPHSLTVRTMISCHVSDDGGTCAGFYQVKPRVGRLLRQLLIGLLDLRWVEAPRRFLRAMATRNCLKLESEFTSNMFLVTHQARGSALPAPPPTVDTLCFPDDTPLDVMLQAHRSRIEQKRACWPALQPEPVSSFEELAAMHGRLKALENAHRAVLGWASRDELNHIACGQPLLAEEVFSQVQKLMAGLRR